LLLAEDLDANTLAAARTVKAIAGQVNVVMHAAGIMLALPWILDPGETVQSLSLGAGTVGSGARTRRRRAYAPDAKGPAK